MRFPRDGVLTPAALRELADMMEKREAYAEATFTIDEESHKVEMLGTDGYGRAHRQWYDKSVTIKVTVLGAVEVQHFDGTWEVYH